MRKLIPTIVLTVIGLVVGFITGKQNSLTENQTSNVEIQILSEIREKCRTADEKGKTYFKKYGDDKEGQEPLNSDEWFEAQSWEQACLESMEDLRKQLTE